MTSQAGKAKDRGFTLIELMVAIFLMGIVLTFSIPRVKDTLLHDDLKTAVRYLSNTSLELRNRAVREQVDLILHIDLDNNNIWSLASDMIPEKKAVISQNETFHLPGAVRIEDVCRGEEEKITEGKATIIFYSKGYAQPTILHIKHYDSYMTLFFEPYLHYIKFKNGYIAFKDMSS